MVGRPLITYFSTKMSLGYKNMRGKFENNSSQFFNQFLKFDPLPPPHLKTIGFFYLSTYFLFTELELAKFWLVLVYSQLVRLCEHPFLICDIPDVICKLDLVFCSQPNRKRGVKKVHLGRDLNPDICGIIDRGFRFLMQVSISSKNHPPPWGNQQGHYSMRRLIVMVYIIWPSPESNN